MVVLYCDRRHKGGGGFSVWCLAADLAMEPLVYNTSHFYFDWRQITSYCDSRHKVNPTCYISMFTVDCY